MAADIDGSTRMVGLIGRPLTHSLSPCIHNSSIQDLDLNQVYVPFELELANVQEAKQFLEWAWRLGVQGLNVTLPYKELVSEALGSELGSVNTVYRGVDGWHGASTDGAGFWRAVERLMPKSKKLAKFQRMILMGNGGAAFALAKFVLDNHLCRSCSILRRSIRKDAQWTQALGPDRIEFVDFDPDTLKSLLGSSAPGQTLLVQASSAALHGDDLSGFAMAMPEFSGAFVDIVYGHPSAMLERAKQLRIPCQDGLPMLIEQARESQRLWWGQSASYESLSRLIQ